MNLSDLPLNPTTRALRQFAGAWLVFFSLMAAHQYFRRGHHEAGLLIGAAALIFGVLGLVKPGAVRWLFVTWMVAAFPIGWAISQVMMLLMFYLLITPIALILRLRGRDPLNRKPAPGRSSWWLSKPSPQDVRSYFRQY